MRNVDDLLHDLYNNTERRLQRSGRFYDLFHLILPHQDICAILKSILDEELYGSRST